MKFKIEFINIFKIIFLLYNINFSYSEIDRIIRLADENFMYFQFSSKSNGDMVIDISSSNTDESVCKERRFFGLKKNGRFLFYKNNQETPILTLYTQNYAKNKLRSTSGFIKLSPITSDEKEYLFSFSTYLSTAETYDLENGKVYDTYSIGFFKKSINSIISTFFKCSYQQDSTYYYYHFGITTNAVDSGPIYLFKDYFSSAETSEIHLTIIGNGNLQQSNKYIISCFETKQFRIICLYQNTQKKLEIYGYSQSSQYTYSGDQNIILDDTTLSEDIEIFFKGIHLKEEIGVFMYYTSNTLTSNYPKISFKKYVDGSGMQALTTDFNSIQLDKTKDFNPGLLLNDIIKMSDNKICIASASNDKKSIYLVILSLFENDSKMIISYYNIELASLNHMISQDIKIFLYNNYISFGFNHCLSSSCGDSDSIYSSLIIFNYPNATDYNLDLIKYLSENNNDIDSLNINFSENITIENNIFGYEMIGVKIISISEKINIYFRTNNTKILANYIVPKDNFIKITLDEDSYSEESMFSIEYSSKIKDSPLISYIENSDYNEYININNINELEDFEENEYDGKTLFFNITIKNLLTNEGCTTEQCSLCYSSDKDNCVACIDKYYYNEDDNKCLIKPVNNILTTIITTIPKELPTTIIKPIPTTIIVNEEMPTTNLIITTIPELKIPTTIPEEKIITTIPEVKIMTTIPAGKILTTIPKEKIVTTLPVQKILTTIPEEKLLTTIPEEKIVNTIPKEKILTTIPEEKIVNTIPKEKILTTILEEKIVNTIPKEKILTTIFEEKIVNTIPKEKILATIPEENILTTIPKLKIVTTIFEEKILSTINEEKKTISISSQNIDISSIISEEESKCSNKDIYENICYYSITSQQVKVVYTELREGIEHGQYNYTINTIYQTANAIFQIAKMKEQQNSENLNISTIDFDECEKIIREEYKFRDEDDLIILKTDLKSDDSSEIYVQYEVFNPINLQKIPLDICENVTIDINIPISLNEETESLYISLINSGYNLFNSSDSFYSDICQTYTTEYGTDITLLDRTKIIFDSTKNVYLCQEGCEFILYNETTKKSKCNCNAQKNETITDIKKLKFDKKEIVEKFLINSLKNSNFKVVKCYKLVLSIKGQLNNYGSFILIVIILILFICMICYCILGNKKLKEFIQLVIRQKFFISPKKINNEKKKRFLTNSFITNKHADINNNNKKSKNNIKKYKACVTESNKKSKKKNNASIKDNNKKLQSKNKPCITESNKKFKTKKKSSITENNKKLLTKNKDKNKNNIKNKNIKKDKKKNLYPPKKQKGKYLRFTKSETSFINSPSTKKESLKSINVLINKKSAKTLMQNNKELRDSKIKKGILKTVKISKFSNKIKKDNIINEKFKKKNIIDKINVLTLNDEELNSLEYHQAILYDKRTYMQYYAALLKKKQLILFTFIPAKDYNLTFIKISLFFLSFSLYFAVNALFFTDETMHKITEDHGDFDLIYQLPQICYSSIISAIINMILKKLSLSELQILTIKKSKTLEGALNNSKAILNCLRIRFIIFFILSFLLAFVFWYFIAAFCAVYKNTQIILIENTFLSFGISMLYPFALNLLPGMFRIPALRAPKKDKQCLYKFSGLVSLI